MNRGDKWLVELDQRSEEAGLRVVATIRWIVEKILEVIARAECIAGSVREHNLRFVVLGSGIEKLGYCRVHVRRHCVLLFRSIELDSKYVLEALGHDLRHFHLLRFCSWSPRRASNKGAMAGDGFTNDQILHLICAFVGIEGFRIREETADIVVSQDAVAPQELTTPCNGFT